MLSRLLDGLPIIKMFQSIYGGMVVTNDIEVRGVGYNSRNIGKDYMFVAIRGASTDGHKYIDQAVNNGARVVVVDDDGALPDFFFMHTGVTKIVVQDSRKALARIAANFHEHPSKKLRLVGVTGTNGKTTTTHLIKSVLAASGELAGLIGTIGYVIGEETIPATHTTPESLELNELLSTMVTKGCSAAVMEVSSHSLALHRVDGLEFGVAVFTNLTQDHLDFHQTMDGYFAAKQILFETLSSSSVAVLNIDDKYGARIAERSKAAVITYGTTPSADVSVTGFEMSINGAKIQIKHANANVLISTSLTGRFNISNILAAYGAGVALGIPTPGIVEGIQNLRTVRGRFEQITSPDGWTAIVDYAHTPDALENCLRTIREVLPAGRRGKIITVFGCGGNRDRGKRPLMGRIASELSDVTVVTSDNPRDEEPGMIIGEIAEGVVRGASVHTEVERRNAIALALDMARSGDVVLVAGKGHEDYQVIRGVKHHFDDREEIERYIAARQ